MYVGTSYIWGNYTLVVMPPAFPESGMANPLLAYTSGTTVVGDSSMAYVQARNLAQAWIGMQVTPQNWEDQWLMEGISTHLQRNVYGFLYTEEFALTEAYQGNTSLNQQSGVIGLPNATYYSLHPVLHGANPD